MKYLTIFGTIEFGNAIIGEQTAPSYIGGNAVAASLAASLYIPVYLMGVVGTDMDMHVLQKMLGKSVNCENIEQYAGKSFRYTAIYDTKSFDVKEHKIDFGVYSQYSPLVKIDEIRYTENILFSGSNPKYSLRVLEQLKAPKIIGVSTMLYHLENNYEYASRLMKEATYLFTNKKEHAYIQQKLPNLFTFAKNLAYIFITDGKNGVTVVSREDEKFIPFDKSVTPLDPTNAGDVFAGTIMGQLLTGLPIETRMNEVIMEAHRQAIRVITNDSYYRKVYETN